MTAKATPFAEAYFMGTKVALQSGDLIVVGHLSNFGTGKQAAYVYVTATLDPAIWGAELAMGEGPGRIYVVEPTGPLEDDPNLTDKKFPGNPTMSYRTRAPVRVLGEVSGWQGHPPEQIAGMKANVADLLRRGIEAIED